MVPYQKLKHQIISVQDIEFIILLKITQDCILIFGEPGKVFAERLREAREEWLVGIEKKFT